MNFFIGKKANRGKRKYFFKRSRKPRVQDKSFWWQIGKYTGYSSDNKTSQIKRILLGVIFLSMAFLFLGRYLYSAALADSFYPHGDARDCGFAQAVSVSYSNLPDRGTGDGDMWYDLADLSGETDGYIHRSDFFDVGEVRYPNARRYNGVADSVSVPPSTDIDFGLYIFNFSGHRIRLDESYLFLSRASTSNGDLTRLGATGTWGSRGFKYYDRILSRTGYYRTISSVGSWDNSSWSNPPRGIEIYSFKTIQPITMENYRVTHSFGDDGELLIGVSFWLENTSDYQLSNISVNHNLPLNNSFSRNYNFFPGQRKFVKYSANLGLNYPLSFKVEPVVVSDPNRYKESVSVGAGSSVNFNPETRTLISRRGDSGAPGNWWANQPDFSPVPGGDFIEVELIPYEFRSDSVNIDLKPELSIEKFISDSDEEMVKTSNSQPGEILTYAINVRNTGARVENVVLKDIYDTGLVEIVDDGDFSLEDGYPVLELSDIPYGFDESYVFSVRIINDLDSGEYVVLNTVTTECEDSICEDLEDSVESQVDAFVDLNLDKEVWDGVGWVKNAEFEDPEHIRFQVSVKNNGNTTSVEETLQDTVDCGNNAVLEISDTPNFVTNSILPGDEWVKIYEYSVIGNLEPGQYVCENSVGIGDLEKNVDFRIKITEDENQSEEEDDTEVEQEIRDSRRKSQEDGKIAHNVSDDVEVGVIGDRFLAQTGQRYIAITFWVLVFFGGFVNLRFLSPSMACYNKFDEEID